MYIEERLNTIESKLDQIFGRLLSMNAIPQGESGVAGAGADPVVAQQVDKAIADATPAAPKRGRGRPPKAETTEAAPAPQSGTPGNGIIADAKPTPPVAQPDPFSLDAPAAPPATPRTIEEVRAALMVYQANTDQGKAMQLIKDVTGFETLAALAKQGTPEQLSKLFKAAIPADKLSLTDVRAVLVAAEARKKDGGFGVLKSVGGVSNITQLPEDKYIEVISKAFAVQ